MRPAPRDEWRGDDGVSPSARALRREPGFFVDAGALRTTFLSRFSRECATSNIWAYRYERARYAYLCAPLESVFGEDSVRRVYDHLRHWSIRNLGLGKVSRAEVRLYFNGHGESPYNDSPRSGWKYILSLSEATHDLPSGAIVFTSSELTASEEVEPRFNELLAVDARERSGVRRVESDSAPESAHVIIQGFFEVAEATNQRIYVDGHLTRRMVMAPLSWAEVEIRKRWHRNQIDAFGVYAVRISVEPSGVVCDVHELSDQIDGASRFTNLTAASNIIHEIVRSLRFSREHGGSEVVAAFVFPRRTDDEHVASEVPRSERAEIMPASLAAALFETPSLFPVYYDASAQQLQFIPMTPVTYHASPFLDHRVVREEAVTYGLSLLEVENVLASRLDQPRPFHSIFHSAFCCSTLLARYLEAIPKTLVLKEPATLSQVGVERSRAHNRFAVGQWDRTLAVVLALLARTFQEEQRVFIKLNDVNILGGAEIVECSHSQTASFIYSDLSSFVVQVLKTESRVGWISGRASMYESASSGDLPCPAEPGNAFPALIAYVWANAMLGFRVLRGVLGPRIRSFSADDICDRPLDAISWCLQGVGMQPELAELETAIAGSAAQRHSKHMGMAYNRRLRDEELHALRRKFSEEVHQAVAWIARETPSLLDVALGRSEP